MVDLPETIPSCYSFRFLDRRKKKTTRHILALTGEGLVVYNNIELQKA